MSLNKAIKYGKEKRKPYRRAKAVDPMCRNHGGDDWELSNRIHKYKKVEAAAEEQKNEYVKNVTI